MASVSRTHSSTSPNAGVDDHQHIRLACQACQRKKIKCDRNFPCGQCTRSSLQCVPSTRKPRTRHGGKRAVDLELRHRIAKLESLVESLSGEVGHPDDVNGSTNSPTREPLTPAGPVEAASSTVGKYIGGPFWSSLTAEVQGLRDALEEQDDADDEPTSPTTSSSNGGKLGAGEYDLIVCPPARVYIMPGALDEPNLPMQVALFDTFFQNISPMFKLFHEPTVRNTVERGAPYLGDDANSPPIRTMKSAMWLAALNSLTDSECQSRFHSKRADLLPRYKRSTEVLFTQVDLCNTNSMAALQAFIVYLAAARITDHSRRAWTLMPTAVRIARAIGLDHERSGCSPHENELRRRTWHQLRFLDVFTAVDRGTEVLITPGSYTTPIPNNVNDCEFDESSAAVPNHETGLTDMSFGLLATEATAVTQHLSVTESSPTGETWQQRLELAEKFRKHVREKYSQYCDMSIPFHRLISAVGNSMGYSMILRAVRPIQRHVSSVPPRVDSPYVLKLATDSLRETERIYQDVAGGGFRWLVWVQWHAIAVALAGLCSIRDTELAKDAWQAVEAAIARYEKHVADTKNGMLWRPIEKLYKKAKAFRDDGRRQSMNTPPSKIETQLVGEPGQEPPTTTKVEAQPTNTKVEVKPRLANKQPASQQTDYRHQRRPSNHSSPLGSLAADTTFPNLPMDFNSFPAASDPSLAGLSQAFHNSDLTSSTAFASPTVQSNGGDMSWMDWERIMDDMPMDSIANGFDMVPNMGDMSFYTGNESSFQQPGVGLPGQYDDLSAQYEVQVPSQMGDGQRSDQARNGQSWPCNLHPDLL
ncbi:Fungal specific transcription factor domain [Teratosphaeria destructans]|uniref:Fungal specific transcription factor domain n=1 Tax=Teratosphaeria destructans TaxID=418781 RepID=A0A9W7W4H3_9PEZI|nr:Fungal specific transcription factor domain [Teratosphaeria destructans]